jgi:glycosyltransferase involved in cell wall biosynthesis
MYTLTEIFLFVVLILSIGYVAFLERWTASWRNVVERIGSKSTTSDFGLSVIIPFRNEEASIAHSVAAICAQVDSNFNIEFIFVDDNSEDNSFAIVQKLIIGDKRFRILKSEKAGKKEALRFGIAQSSFDFVVTLDSDCVVRENWLSQIRRELVFTQSDFLILPVLVNRPKSFWGDVAYTEWLSLTAVTGGSAMSEGALMCNGANLAFRKKLYELYDVPNEHSVSSGDDMFLMIQAKKVGIVAYSANIETAAWTDLPAGFGSFISQRVRWAGKTKKMNDKSILLFGSLLFFLQIMSLLLLITMCFLGGNWLYFIGLIGLKLLFEYRLLAESSRVFNIRWSFTSLMVMSLLHPFYTIFVALLSLVYRPSWKGRKIKI